MHFIVLMRPKTEFKMCCENIQVWFTCDEGFDNISQIVDRNRFQTVTQQNTVGDRQQNSYCVAETESSPVSQSAIGLTGHPDMT